ncbi:RNA polymerase sporulation sigma factor SigK [Abyssisolibacter fermentans]|uniref:RNA polymerase sporulation sigma factor SigK n=1 Tax=Abyssisolibacter fermentans TaxID=1766203 RepID=UPI00082EF3EC|nr:RNA polymerase sporulation sigma factor SigK [Abyssisolibacter fermentans]
MLCFIINFIQLLKPYLFFVGYISNANSFPEPLSKEEEEKYIILLEQGNEEAKNILIQRNLRLVAHIVKKYGNTNRETDDLISIGTIGLIKAISTFDRTKGSRLATYAARCIDNEILMTIRADKKIKSEVSLHDPIGVDKEGNEISLIDILGSEVDEVVDKVHLQIQIKKLYKKMSKVLRGREKTIIELRYGLTNVGDKTQREIAKNLGISRSYVSRIEKKAIEKLNKALTQSD